MTHPVNDIADAFVDLLMDETDAEDRVCRDRQPALDVRSELPAIVVHIGEDDPVDDQVHGRWRSTARINVDLYVTALEDDISRVLMGLRTQTYKLIMAEPVLGLPSVIRCLPGGAEEVLRGDSAIPIGYLRTAYFVLYQHSFTDPAQ